MRGRAAELLCDGFLLFGEVSAEARARVGVDLSRVSAGPRRLLMREFARARPLINRPQARVKPVLMTASRVSSAMS